jgi:hypothetical protein
VPSVGHVKRLSLPSAAYIAGLMDGEGTITLPVFTPVSTGGSWSASRTRSWLCRGSYKRDRAILVLDSYATLTPRNGKYTAEQLQRRKTLKPNGR